MEKLAGEILKEEHILAEKIIYFLGRAAEDLENRKTTFLSQTQKMMNAAETFLLEHHKKEMEVFAVLAKNTSASKAVLLDVLVQEHDLGKEYIMNIKKIISRKKLAEEERFQLLPFHIRKYIQLLSSHIKKEEKSLFPLIKKQISFEMSDQLGEKFQEMSRKLNFRQARDFILNLR